MTHSDERDWSKISKPAQDAYWEARRAGKNETEALLEALKVAIVDAEKRAAALKKAKEG